MHLGDVFSFLHQQLSAVSALQSVGGARALTVDDAVRARAEGVPFFDASLRFVFERERIPGATHVPYDTFGPDVLPTDFDAPILFYCHNAL